MQGGLISYRSRKKRFTVLFQRDGHTFKSVGPSRLKVSLDADLIKARSVIIFR
jgi:hypothetical protein